MEGKADGAVDSLLTTSVRKEVTCRTGSELSCKFVHREPGIPTKDALSRSSCRL